MRSLWTALLAVLLLNAPSLGLINVKVTADGTIAGGKVQLGYGQTTTVRIWAQGTTAGIYMLGGDVIGGGSVLSTNMYSFAWVPEFRSSAIIPPKVGIPGSGGGWSSIGSMQTNFTTPDATYGFADYVQVASYTVTAGSTPGDCSLYFSPRIVSDFRAQEADRLSEIIGEIIPVTIHVPEPMTMACLAIAAVWGVRRRLV